MQHAKNSMYFQSYYETAEDNSYHLPSPYILTKNMNLFYPSSEFRQEHLQKPETDKKTPLGSN